MYRHISKGGWTYSDQDHGWQLSDCTAHGLMVNFNVLKISLLMNNIVQKINLSTTLKRIILDISTF